MACEIGEALAARKFPVSVQYGPDRVLTSAIGYVDATIVFERDRTNGDSFGPAIGPREIARVVRTRTHGFVVRIYSMVNVAGAMLHDHEDECDKFVSAVVSEITQWCKINRAGEPEFQGKFLYPEDVQVDGTLNGVVYELKCKAQQSVDRVDYEGNAGLVTTIATVSTNSVTVEGGDSTETIDLSGA
jgi:hypothetical protein